MDKATFFLAFGLVVMWLVDAVRHLDKNDRVPKGWWIIVAAGVAELLALGVCNTALIREWAHLDASGCQDTLLIGAGFAASGTFWHQLISALSSVSGPGLNQKGYWNTTPPTGE